MTNPDAPRVTEWAEEYCRNVQHRTIGPFRLTTERIGDEWTWAVTVRVVSAGGRYHLDSATHYERDINSAKAACEAAARRAGIAVPR